ncbi:MAG: glycosyltransferase, partial [Clostridia bacterium]|nr:glycosyltransferase [Clostridia bacterium]
MNTPATLYFVVPWYNDEDTLPASVPVFLKKLRSLTACGAAAQDSRLVLINDGSADATWNCIVRMQRENPDRITGLNLAGNFGEQNALVAGMTFSLDRADCVITMDSDLQDDINAVDGMLECYYAGKDVVYGVRNDRSSDGAFEKLSSRLFYVVMKTAKTGLVNEHSNYRLLSRRAMERLLDDLPVNYFLPCSVSNLGMPGAVVTYRRLKRISGASGYSLARKICLAKDALFSHSAFPLKLLSCAGVFGLLAAFLFFLLFLLAGKAASHPYFLPL